MTFLFLQYNKSYFIVHFHRRGGSKRSFNWNSNADALTRDRGPKAARIYKEAREAAIASGKLKKPEDGREQTVSVLRDGFAEFGKKYKVCSSLSEIKLSSRC